MQTEKIHVNLKEKSYDIFIGENLLSNCGEIIKDVIAPCKAFIISDSNVAPLYLETVSNSLESVGFETTSHIFPFGEENKTIDTVITMVCDMADESISRTDCVFALGGGVTGDMAGFAAAMYMRGIKFVQLSTSLLSSIDSSVGGKTGCDLDNGKNLVGAFHQPKCVIIDTKTLETLSPKYLSDGMGEMIKYGVIKSESLFEKIMNNSFDEIKNEAINECVCIKRDIVENDEFEHGERKLLNFGHTLGHAIEKYYDFTGYSHGEAITIGMVLVAKAAANNCICDIEVAEKIIECANKYNLPTECDADMNEILKIVLNDKKRRGTKIDIIVPEKIGKASILTLKIDELNSFFGI